MQNFKINKKISLRYQTPEGVYMHALYIQETDTYCNLIYEHLPLCLSGPNRGTLPGLAALKTYVVALCVEIICTVASSTHHIIIHNT